MNQISTTQVWSEVSTQKKNDDVTFKLSYMYESKFKFILTIICGEYVFENLETDPIEKYIIFVRPFHLNK